MNAILDKFDGGELIGLTAVLGGLAVAAIAIIATQWRRVRIAEMENALKQQMLEKGLSPADIEQVMKANHQATDSAGFVSGVNEAQNRAALVQRMVDEGYEGADIERVLKAYEPGKQPAQEKAAVNWD